VNIEDCMLPRGIRNQNPLNIRRTGNDKWQGLSERQQDSEFCQFRSLVWGWRAAFHLLTRTYYKKYGLDTIRKIISRWAPPKENHTQRYIENVSRLTGIGFDEPLGDPEKHAGRWMMVGMAMAIQENGTDVLDVFAMMKGWERVKIEN